MGTPSYFNTFLRYHLQRFREMAPMKAKAAVRAMSKGGIAEALASGCEVKKSVASKLRHACQCCDCGSEEDRRFHCARFGPIEDSHEASNEGREKGGLRQSCHGEGKASTKNCQSVPSRRFESEHLKEKC